MPADCSPLTSSSSETKPPSSPARSVSAPKGVGAVCWSAQCRSIVCFIHPKTKRTRQRLVVRRALGRVAQRVPRLLDEEERRRPRSIVTDRGRRWPLLKWMMVVAVGFSVWLSEHSRGPALARSSLCLPAVSIDP